MAMAKLFPSTTKTTMLAILLLSIATLATHGVTTTPISAPELEDCMKKATAGKCRQEFVTGALKKGSIVKRCCGVLKDVGEDCFIGILKNHQLSTKDNVNWDGFWNNSTKILQQCQLSS